MLTRFFRKTESRPPSCADLRYLESVSCLQGLVRGHTFIDLRSEPLHHEVRSMVLEVNATEGLFRIDQPFPPQQEVYLVEGKEFEVFAVAPDGPVHFNTRVQHCEEDGDGPSYLCAIPMQIERNQRRHEFRLNLAPEDGVAAEVDVAEDMRTSADVLNLSASGMRVRLPRHEDWLEPGSRVSAPCRLNLRDRGNIRCRLVMRNLVIDEDRPDHWLMGASFAGMDRYQQRQLGGYIAQRQRQQMRGAA